jgi:hypothetical protein
VQFVASSKKTVLAFAGQNSVDFVLNSIHCTLPHKANADEQRNAQREESNFGLLLNNLMLLSATLAAGVDKMAIPMRSAERSPLPLCLFQGYLLFFIS